MARGAENKNALKHEKRAADMLRALATVVRERRIKLSMSQEELAERAQLHRTYISDIERGNRNIALLNLCRLAWALDISCATLVDRAEHLIG